MNKQSTTLVARHSLALAAIAALSACGGGSDDTSPSTTTPPPASPAALTVSGRADAGAAVAAAPVAVKCAAGSGSGTTAADGAYSVAVAAGTAPCVVEVTRAGGGNLHSLVESGISGSATANVTPLTELMTAQVAAATAGSLFTTFDAAAQARVTPAAIAAARTALTSALAGRVDLAGVDPIKDTLAAGNALDQKVDTLTTLLAQAQVTLPELSAALVANPGSAAASGCRQLKSGPIASVALDGRLAIATLDATALTVRHADGSTDRLVDAGGCRFTTQGTSDVALVSPGSLIVGRAVVANGTFQPVFTVPLQTVAASELAGTWNLVGYNRDPSGSAPNTYSPEHGTLILDAAGTVLAGGVDCTGVNTCRAGDGAGARLVANAQGGFNVVDPSGPTASDSRAFAYRTPSGGWVMLINATSSDNRGLYVLTRQAALTAPAVGAVTTFNQFSTGPAGTAGALSGDVSTTVAVDPAGTSFDRTLADGHRETLLLNQPRNGMRQRNAGSSAGSNGTPVAFNASVQMRIPSVGMTLSLSSASTQNFFNTSVDVPSP